MISQKMIIDEDAKILKSLSVLNQADNKCLIVVDKKKKVKGTLTDGDIRRAILKNKSFNSSIKKIYNKKFKFFYERNYKVNEIVSILKNKENHIDAIPILNKYKKLIKILTLENLFKNNDSKIKEIKDTKIIIMAGGLGTRLMPLTKRIPKPLIKFKDKTFIDIILNNFFIQGFKNFGITLFHKKKLIQSYLKKNKKYNVKCISEKKPLGTAGGLSYLKNYNEKYFIVTNCDNFYKINYYNLLKYHKRYKYDFTIVASKKTLKLPYGICKIINGKFDGLVEKPEYSNLVNSGLYVLNKKVLKFLRKKKIDMNDYIDVLKRKNIKIGIYPIDENSWIDVGTLSSLNSELNLD